MTSSYYGSQNGGHKIRSHFGNIVKNATPRGIRGIMSPNVSPSVAPYLSIFIRIQQTHPSDKHADRQTVKIKNGPLDLEFGMGKFFGTGNPKIEVTRPENNMVP